MAFPFPVLFIAVSLLSAFPPSCESYGHGSCIESERTALLSIKAGLFQNNNNNNNNNISWLSSWTGRDCCQWQGVACNQESGHVIKLNLRNPYLQYPYPDDYYFNMPPNDLRWLSGFTALRYLDLSYVNLSKVSGWLHDVNMLPSLRVLKLSDAQLQGGIHALTPAHLNFTALRVLDLTYNNFSATFPQWMFNLTSLEQLGLSSNGFHGSIPENIGRLRNLQYLDLSRNVISGEIPEAFGNLTLLQYFDASWGNTFSGKLLETTANLVHLQVLYLTRNGIVGQLPESIGKLSSLMELDLSENNISGTLPKTMGNLCNLQYLDLKRNFISGPIDDLLNGLSECFENKESNGLSELHLGENRLNGTVPESLSRLYKMEWLDLRANSLTGTLTELHFANLTDLQIMDFSYNMLQLNVTEDWVPPFNARGHERFNSDVFS
ncbi:hypothetical protein J5N97_024111 [Dioscorea zingiberensis]|uniref:Leucine-rich repeat-containing N-terminal plant-type domain-containing protein n=1 Tax=Dioscorea zingiberensis TaxID=325984 RepID=A0A9D5C6I0_9LILI|nr:hypothetical protein J5N97_024111 [Dioscorea zingiberensis]